MSAKKIKKPVSILGIKPDVIEAYIKFAEEKDVKQLIIEEHGVRIIIHREEKIMPPQAIISQKTTNQLELFKETVLEEKSEAETVSNDKIKSEESNKYHKIISPIMGTFYRASSPTSPPFVEQGDIVVPGQTLCIVEAMKVMNKINSDIKGKIVKIMKKNQEAVKKDETLFLLEPV